MRHPLSHLRRALDPRLEWVHDKPIGPEQNYEVHPTWSIAWRINRGSALMRSENGEWRAGPGSWVFLQPCRRYQEFAPGTRIWSIASRCGRSGGASWYHGPDALVLSGDPDLDRTGKRLVAAVADETRKQRVAWPFDFMCHPAAWLRIDAAFRLWLAAAMTAVGRHGARLAADAGGDERVAAALECIARDPWGSSSEPGALAAAAGLSRRRLEQLFAADLGHGLAEARTRARVEHAQELLGRGELSVKEISLRLGFASLAAFSGWFRRHAGQSPRRFRGGEPCP